jgi:hypothetical protein
MNKTFIEEQQKIAREKLEWACPDDIGHTMLFHDDINTLISQTILATEAEIIKNIEDIDTGFETRFNLGARQMKELILSTLTPEK